MREFCKQLACERERVDLRHETIRRRPDLTLFLFQMGMSSPVLASLRCPSEVLPSPSLTPAAVSILNQVKDIRINPVFCPFVHSLDKWRSSKATGDAQQHRVGQTSSVKRRKTNWWQLAKNSSRTCLPLYPPLLALPRRPSVLERSPNCRRRWPKRR